MSNSSWKDQIQKKWGPHTHCPVCGKAMAPERKVCSQACNDNYIAHERKQKKKGRKNMICMVVMVAVLMLIMFVPMLFQ